MSKLRLIALSILVLSLVYPFVPAAAQVPALNPSYGSASKFVMQQLPLMGAGTNGILAVSSTYNFVLVTGHREIITGLIAAAIAPPSGASDVTVQFFKSGTTNAISGVYDLNSLAAGVSASIPVTGNNFLNDTDFVVCQVVTGSSIGTASGLAVCVQSKTTGK